MSTVEKKKKGGKKTATAATTSASSDLVRVSVHLIELQIIIFFPSSTSPPETDNALQARLLILYRGEKEIRKCSILIAVLF